MQNTTDLDKNKGPFLDHDLFPDRPVRSPRERIGKDSYPASRVAPVLQQLPLFTHIGGMNTRV